VVKGLRHVAPAERAEVVPALLFRGLLLHG